MNKTLVLYVFHEFNNRVEYFINNSIFKHPLVDFIIIYNNNSNNNIIHTKLREMIPEYVNVIVRENLGYDFGGWSRALFNPLNNYNDDEKYLYEKYKYFIFLNSSVIGPFVPIYYKKKWTDIFIEQLNEQNSNNNVKIIGPTINACGGMAGIYVPVEHGAHVQTYLFCIERNTLDFLIKEKIFENENENKNLINYYKNMTFNDAIRKEISMSRKIIENGGNIGSMLKMYINVDFTFKNKTSEQYKKNNIIFYGDIMYKDAINKLWSEYDVVFFKGNRIL
jgi:hypothetical protein